MPNIRTFGNIKHFDIKTPMTKKRAKHERFRCITRDEKKTFLALRHAFPPIKPVSLCASGFFCYTTFAEYTIYFHVRRLRPPVARVSFAVDDLIGDTWMASPDRPKCLEAFARKFSTWAIISARPGFVVAEFFSSSQLCTSSPEADIKAPPLANSPQSLLDVAFGQ